MKHVTYKILLVIVVSRDSRHIARSLIDLVLTNFCSECLFDRLSKVSEKSWRLLYRTPRILTP